VVKRTPGQQGDVELTLVPLRHPRRLHEKIIEFIAKGNRSQLKYYRQPKLWRLLVPARAVLDLSRS